MTAAKDPLDEAVRLLGRAKDARSRLRALESVRASLALELKDHARSRTALKSPTDDQVAKLKANLADAWAEYEAVAAGGVETSLRALQGVREAISQLRAAEARLGQGDRVTVTVKDYDGRAVTTFEGDAASWYDFYGVPEEFRGPEHRIDVHVTWGDSADVRVYPAKGRRRLLWRKPGVPDAKPPPRRALPHEEPTR